MDILYTLIPLSVVLVFLVIALLGWAVHAGQFEDLDAEASRVLDDDEHRDAATARPAGDGGTPASAPASAPEPLVGDPRNPLLRATLDLDQDGSHSDRKPSRRAGGPSAAAARPFAFHKPPATP